MSRIVVGIDGSEPSRRALRWAIARAGSWGADLDVVHSLELPLTAAPFVGPMGVETIEAEAANLLRAEVDAALATASEQPANVRQLVGRSDAATSIGEAAQGADLVVVGSRGRGGFKGLLLGSVSHRVVHASPCPVVVIAEGDGRPDGPILVGIDHFEVRSPALEWALGEAQRADRPVAVLAAWSWMDQRDRRFDPDFGAAEVRAMADAVVDAARAAVRGGTGVEVEMRVVNALAARALIDQGADASLLVVGTRRLGRVRGAVLGSVSTQVVYHAPCPVAVVPTGETA